LLPLPPREGYIKFVMKDRIEGYRNFLNKIWNASRFILMNIGDYTPKSPQIEKLNIEDKWIITRLEKTSKNVSKAIETYNFNDAASELYQFSGLRSVTGILSLSNKESLIMTTDKVPLIRPVTSLKNPLSCFTHLCLS